MIYIIRVHLLDTCVLNTEVSYINPATETMEKDNQQWMGKLLYCTEGPWPIRNILNLTQCPDNVTEWDTKSLVRVNILSSGLVYHERSLPQVGSHSDLILDVARTLNSNNQSSQSLCIQCYPLRRTGKAGPVLCNLIGEQ